MNPCRSKITRPGALGALVFLWVWVGYSSSIAQGESAAKTTAGKRGAERPVPILAEDAIETTVSVQLYAVGTVEAFSTVEIKSQVAGQVIGAHFREGQEVRKGDLLFTVDSRSYETLLKKEEANLSRDRLQAENAEVEYKRTEELSKGGMAASEELDRARTTAAQLVAQVEADQAAVQYARLQVEYCSVRSPLNGRTGALRVNTGNIVKANEATLTEILEILPIYVSFSVPESYLPTIQRLRSTGQNLETLATIPGEESSPLVGNVTFLNSAVDRKTGTILLKAEFPNGDRRLWPGQYVNINLILERLSSRVLVPTQAVQTGQEGAFVYVVRGDMTVEYRGVKTGRVVDDRVVIDTGLRAGERVVTDGHLRLIPDSRVEIKAGLLEAAQSAIPASAGVRP